MGGIKCVTEKGIYDMHIVEIKNVPLLEQAAEKEMLRIQVRDIMSRDIVLFEAVEIVGNLIDKLESCTHNGFPVVFPGTKRLAGLMSRVNLHNILENGVKSHLFQESGEEL